MAVGLTPFNPSLVGFAPQDNGVRSAPGRNANDGNEALKNNNQTTANATVDSTPRDAETRRAEALDATERSFSRVRRDDNSDLNFRSRSALQQFDNVQQATPSNQPQVLGVDIFV